MDLDIALEKVKIAMQVIVIYMIKLEYILYDSNVS